MHISDLVMVEGGVVGIFGRGGVNMGVGAGAVGTAVGTGVGTAVGTGVGNIVGATVGANVGNVVGTAVGAGVGRQTVDGADSGKLSWYELTSTGMELSMVVREVAFKPPIRPLVIPYLVGFNYFIFHNLLFSLFSCVRNKIKITLEIKI